MPRQSLKTLTEPMYYVLLCLTKACCGIEIMEQVKELSGGRITIGPGTLYTMLSKFEKNGIIEGLAPSYDKRKNYVITEYGKQVLRAEYDRLARMSEDGKKIMGGLQ